MSVKVPIPQDVVEYFGKATYDEFWEELEPMLPNSIYDFCEVTYARAASRHFREICSRSGINPDYYDSAESYIGAMRDKRIMDQLSSTHRHVSVNPKTCNSVVKTVDTYKACRAFPDLNNKMDAELNLLCKLVISGENNLITLRNLQGYYEYLLCRMELIKIYMGEDEADGRAAEFLGKLENLSDVAHAFKSSDVISALDFTVPQPKQG